MHHFLVSSCLNGNSLVSCFTRNFSPIQNKISFFLGGFIRGNHSIFLRNPSSFFGCIILLNHFNYWCAYCYIYSVVVGVVVILCYCRRHGGGAREDKVGEVGAVVGGGPKNFSIFTMINICWPLLPKTALEHMIFLRRHLET